MPEIRISAVCRDFGQHRALDQVDLTIESGSLTALVGPTGCGKTTLLELIGGLQNPSRGRITVDGEDVVGPRRDTILIFQQHNLFDWLTVRDNVAFGLRNRGLSKREARRRANEQLEHVGLAAFVDRVPGELSGGMRQRVALARALVLAPRLLLMDEPFGSLDHQTRRIMQRYLLARWRQSQATIVLVTHDLDEAMRLADRIVLFSASPGRPVEVVDVPAAHPRNLEDGQLRHVRDRLLAHLEEEVALSEFAGAELAALAEAGYESMRSVVKVHGGVSDGSA
ncbi:MAG: ABC transporter ATP-binding protein [Chloroflexi bacterium]|nr:MAG: ABC transporter ATP-binding protein [Chloroflexota bacterium]TMF78087.1 MAG: ABC transporter ATP-binding protein [Chloroflexota bacterium]TMF92769.1 MAG: ABC transporter ATP-binding protein [Chloroflexota bacterium]